MKPHFGLEYALSLVDVPEGLYPVYDAVRSDLVSRALSGEEVYIYHPVGNETVYNLWIKEQRHDLREWNGKE